MTKAEARRLLQVSTDAALARELNLQRSTVRRWEKRVPPKYRQFVLLLRKEIEDSEALTASVPF